jgi:hypothetical protein
LARRFMNRDTLEPHDRIPSARRPR